MPPVRGPGDPPPDPGRHSPHAADRSGGQRRLTGESSDQKHPARPFIQQRYAALLHALVQRLLDAAAAGEVPPLTDERAEREIRTLFATMDGLEIQWLLDPAVDLTGLFDHHLDQTLRRWRAGDFM